MLSFLFSFSCCFFIVNWWLAYRWEWSEHPPPWYMWSFINLLLSDWLTACAAAILPTALWHAVLRIRSQREDQCCRSESVWIRIICRIQIWINNLDPDPTTSLYMTKLLLRFFKCFFYTANLKVRKSLQNFCFAYYRYPGEFVRQWSWARIRRVFLKTKIIIREELGTSQKALRWGSWDEFCKWKK